MSPALAGRFSTTAPPWKPQIQLLVAFHFKEKRNALAVEGPEKKRRMCGENILNTAPHSLNYLDVLMNKILCFVVLRM